MSDSSVLSSTLFSFMRFFSNRSDEIILPDAHRTQWFGVIVSLNSYDDIMHTNNVTQHNK